MFTLPHELNSLAGRQPALVYRLLFKAASGTLLEFGRNPRWLGGEIGVTMVLHTWGQNLGRHIHVHAIVTGGALKSRPRTLAAHLRQLPVPQQGQALSSVFRGKYLDFLDQAHRGGELRLPGTDDFDRLTTALRSHDWVVYTKPPFAGAAHVLAYLGRYTHKIAIANHRLVDFDGEHVRFRWRDYADCNRRKTMRLHADEFVRRFLSHVLPRGFTRLRHYGLLANRGRDRKLALCRALIEQPAPPPRETETPQAMLLCLTGIDITRCPHCGHGTLQRVRVLVATTAMRRRAWQPP